MFEGASLNVSYRKQLSIINYEPTNRYEEIIKLIMQRFNIPASHEKALLISTENGRIFDRQLFDYFLTLFPNPSIVFYIRYDYNRAISLLQTTQQQQQQGEHDKINIAAECSDDINMAKNKKKHKLNDDGEEGEEDDCACKFTPVFRMNCFIYEYPTSSKITKTTSDNTSAKKKKSNGAEKQSPRSEFVKRVKKHLQVGELKKRTKKPLAQVKRIMRL